MGIINFDKYADDIVTVDQARELVKATDRLLDLIYQLDLSWEQKTDECLSHHQIKIVEGLRSEASVPTENKIKLKKWLGDLKYAVKDLPVIRLHVAVELSNNSVIRIARAIRKILGKFVLLDFVLDEKLIGGAVVVEQGIRKDLSLAIKIKQYINSVFVDN